MQPVRPLSTLDATLDSLEDGLRVGRLDLDDAELLRARPPGSRDTCESLDRDRSRFTGAGTEGMFEMRDGALNGRVCSRWKSSSGGAEGAGGPGAAVGSMVVVTWCWTGGGGPALSPGSLR